MKPIIKKERPKLDRDWTRKKLDSAAALGADGASDDELSELIGDRGMPPSAVNAAHTNER